MIVILFQIRIHKLFVIACVILITSVEAERSFSLLRRIKTYTRSTIAMHYGERISVLTIFELHSFKHIREDYFKHHVLQINNININLASL